MIKLEDRIKKHEGNPGVIYKDSLGNLTGGWGHLMREGGYISSEVAEHWFQEDIDNAIAQYIAYIPANIRREKLNVAREGVIVEMIFNMGIHNVLGFKKMFAAIEIDDFEEAADQMLDSRWADQVGKKPGQRAHTLSEIMRTGLD